MKKTVACVIGVGASAAGLAVVYRSLLRRRCLTWGATVEEVEQPLPGDDLLAEPDIVATRAVWIDAPPKAIWPWLVQMGSGRGGAYTYDWIENLLGLDMHSAKEILPEFQDLKVGDTCPLGSRAPACGWRSSTQNAPWCSAPRTETGCGPSRCSPPLGGPGSSAATESPLRTPPYSRVWATSSSWSPAA